MICEIIRNFKEALRKTFSNLECRISVSEKNFPFYFLGLIKAPDRTLQFRKNFSFSKE